MSDRRFCVFIHTFFQGAVPAIRESNKKLEDRICTFETEREAQIEMVDFMMIRLKEFLNGQREFADAVTLEEYVEEVTVLPDGSIILENGRCLI